MRKALLVLLILSSVPTEAQTPQDLCKGMKGEDLKVCLRKCTHLPADQACLFALRFGAKGWQALRMVKLKKIEPYKAATIVGMTKEDSKVFRSYLDYLGIVKIYPLPSRIKSSTLYNLALQFRKKAFFLYHKGYYVNSISFFKELIKMYLKLFGEENPRIAALYRIVGVIYYRLEDYYNALRYFGAALEIDKKAYIGPHPSIAKDWRNIAGVAEMIGLYSTAMDGYQIALDIDRKMFFMSSKIALDYYLIARAMLNTRRWFPTPEKQKRGVWKFISRYHRATSILEKALRILVGINGANHIPIYNYIFKKFLVVNLITGHYPHYSNLKLLLQILRVEQRKFGVDHPRTIETLEDIALVYYMTRKYEEAERYYKKALILKRKVFGHQNLETAKTLVAIAKTLWAEGKKEESQSFLVKALDIEWKWIVYNLVYSESEVPLLLNWYFTNGQIRSEYAECLKICKSRPKILLRQIFLWQHVFFTLAKAKHTLNSLIKHSYDYGLSPNILKKFFHLRKTLIAMKMMTPFQGVKYFKKQIETKKRLIAHFTDKLASLKSTIPFSLRSVLEMDSPNINLEGTCNILKKVKAALVVYIKYRKTLPDFDFLTYNINSLNTPERWHYMAVVMTPEKNTCDIKSEDLGSQKKIDEVGAYYVNEIRGLNKKEEEFLPIIRKSRLTKLGKKVTDLILAPVLQMSPPNHGLFIVPDGMLTKINFASLPIKDKILIETRPVAYLLSPFDLLRIKMFWPLEDMMESRETFIGWSPDFNKALCPIEHWQRTPQRCRKLVNLIVDLQTTKALIPAFARRLFVTTSTLMNKMRSTIISYLKNHLFYQDKIWAELSKDLSFFKNLTRSWPLYSHKHRNYTGGSTCNPYLRHWIALDRYLPEGYRVASILKKKIQEPIKFARGEVLFKKELKQNIKNTKMVILFTHGYTLDVVDCFLKALKSTEFGKVLTNIKATGWTSLADYQPAIGSLLRLVDISQWSALVFAGANHASLKQNRYYFLTAGDILRDYDLWGTRRVILASCESGIQERPSSASPEFIINKLILYMQYPSELLHLNPISVAQASDIVGAQVVIAPLWPVLGKDAARMVKVLVETMDEDQDKPKPYRVLRWYQRAIKRILKSGRRSLPFYWSAFVPLVGG